MKNFLVVSFLIYVFSSVSAQENSFGLKAGVNLSSFNMSGNTLDNLYSRMAFHIGTVAEFGLSDNFSVQPDLLYSSVGSDLDIGMPNRSHIILNYLYLPLMAKYYVIDGLGLEAGPQVGFLLDAKLKNDKTSQSMKNDHESIDLGLGLGVSYKFRNRFLLGFRYAMGISSISKADARNGTIKNNVFQFSAGYFFK